MLLRHFFRLPETHMSKGWWLGWLLRNEQSKSTDVLRLDLIVNSTSASSLASVSVGATMAEFGLPSYQAFTVLPTSTFLAGYFFGNVMLAPLSEIYGRRPVNLATFSLFGIWMMACALAPNWASFNIFRALTGFFAAGPSSTISG